LEQHDSPVRGGFIHIPYLPEQAAQHPGAPSMALASIIQALEIAVKVTLETGEDIRQAGGATH
ncbi:pyroglutamyl-peptidase I, partial [Pseudomonas sp. SIMBA_064]